MAVSLVFPYEEGHKDGSGEGGRIGLGRGSFEAQGLALVGVLKGFEGLGDQVRDQIKIR